MLTAPFSYATGRTRKIEHLLQLSCWSRATCWDKSRFLGGDAEKMEVPTTLNVCGDRAHPDSRDCVAAVGERSGSSRVRIGTSLQQHLFLQFAGWWIISEKDKLHWKASE